MKVVLFSGKAEAGKTTAANMLKDILEEQKFRVAIIPYGARVKETAKLVIGWNGKKDEKGRQLLQWWGTDVVRKKYPDFWAKSVVELARASEGVLDYILVDDCRFPNEVSCWGDIPYITVRVERPMHENSLTEKQRQHPSETAMDKYRFDILMAATDKDALKAHLDRLTPVFLDVHNYHRQEESDYYALL